MNLFRNQGYYSANRTRFPGADENLLVKMKDFLQIEFHGINF